MKQWVQIMIVIVAIVVLFVGGICAIDSRFKHNICLQASYSDVQKFGGAWYCVRLQDEHLYGTEMAAFIGQGQ